MPSRTAQHFLFPAALFLTLIAALVPVRWQPGWIGELGELVRFPMRPFTEGGTALASWLRPEPRPATGLDTDVDALRRERDLALRLYHAEHQKVLELEGQLDDIRAIPRDTRDRARELVTGYLTSRTPSSTQGPVEVRTESSFQGTVYRNTIAARGVDLLGRTLEDNDTGTCLVLPLVHEATGPIQASIFPRDNPELPLDRAVPVHLEPTGLGRFTGDIHHVADVAPGDTVRLVDTGWPNTAQMMIVGLVTSVTPKDTEPLRHTIVVEPRVRVAHITELTLVLMDRLAEATP